MVLKQNQSGFTLLDFLTSLILVALVIGVGSKFVNREKQSFRNEYVVVNKQETMQHVVDLINKDGRMTGYNPRQSTGIFFFTFSESRVNSSLIDPTTVTLHQDLNGNGSVTEADEIIRYTYDTVHKQIVRSTNYQNSQKLSNEKIILNHVDTCVFVFLDQNEHQITQKALSNTITHVRIAITSKVQRGRSLHIKNQKESISSMVAVLQPRNSAPVNTSLRNSIVSVDSY